MVGPPEISRRASWVVPETDVGSTKQVCSYEALGPNTNFSYYLVNMEVPTNPTRESAFVWICGSFLISANEIRVLKLID